MDNTPIEERAPVEPSDGPLAAPQRRAPALTINIQSWATPIVGLIMLAAGLLLGYFGRPLINPAPVEVAEAPAAATADSAGQGAQQPVVDNSDLPQTREELMPFLIKGTKHFRGDPNAPVTLIEFSDFQ